MDGITIRWDILKKLVVHILNNESVALCFYVFNIIDYLIGVVLYLSGDGIVVPKGVIFKRSKEVT